MTSHDPFAQFKSVQRASWSHFYELENATIPAAAFLVDFAEVKSGQRVLDVACGTGVVSLTAARKGADVCGLDLSPALIERAKVNAQIAESPIDFREGDVEFLPYPDAHFDVVLSQYGHMFAPRPHVAIAEMLRVLKPGGRIAFSTWPPELFVGKSFALLAEYSPLPEGVPPPVLWGEPTIVRERLGDKVRDIEFDRRINRPGFLSVKHARRIFISTLATLCDKLATENPSRLEDFFQRYEKLIASYMKGNVLEQHFLMTRAIKK